MVHSLMFTCAMVVPAVAVSVTDKPNLAQAVWLNDYPDAKCLDGSPGIYYIRTATSDANSKKWVFHIQGGGWCTSKGIAHNNANDCFERSKTNLGSSVPAKSGDAAVSDLGLISGCENNRWCGALMVNDEIVNPYSHDWNAVLIRYCDGASFIGNTAEPVMRNGDPMYYRGWHIMQATLSDLLANHGLASATEVLFGGDSAGGLAAYLHLDYVASRLPPTTRVLGMPDSGFWPDSENFASTFRSMLAEQNGTDGLLPSCVAANPDDVSRCIFPEYFADMIKTPMFPLQSLVDPLQKDGPEGGPQAHSDWLLDQMQRKVTAKEQNGGWLHSCSRHCGASLLTIDGVQYPRAVESFLHNSNPQRLFLQNEAYPCDSCCNDDAAMMDFPKGAGLVV